MEDKTSQRILINPRQRRKKKTPDWQIYLVIVLGALGVFFIILSQSPRLKHRPLSINTPADIVADITQDGLAARAAAKPDYQIQELASDKIVLVQAVGHDCDAALAMGIGEVAQTHEITQKSTMSNPGAAATHTLIDGLVINQPPASCSAVLYVEPM